MLKSIAKLTEPQVVGAGAVGLAVARKLAARVGSSTVLIERHEAIGTETSSRNSEVIHAGLYYGPNSLKTKLCLSGKQMMYALCDKERIPHQICKKWILAQDEQQHEDLANTQEFAKSIGVPTKFIPLSEAKNREPDVLAKSAVLESSTTGIVDSHAYMSFLEGDFQHKGGILACNTNVEAVHALDAGKGGWEIQIKSGSLSEMTSITGETLINSAGLGAVNLSNSILPPERHLIPYYAKGSYYAYTAPTPRPKLLLYPAPKKEAAGLGTHLTIDMTGAVRFGPDVEWVDDPTDLSVNESQRLAAINEIKKYMPNIREDRIQLDYAGIRPKLGKGSAIAVGGGFSDFVIRKEQGFEGLVNLMGIESPGLTSSLAIAEMVDDLLYR